MIPCELTDPLHTLSSSAKRENKGLTAIKLDFKTLTFLWQETPRHTRVEMEMTPIAVTNTEMNQACSSE